MLPSCLCFVVWHNSQAGCLATTFVVMLSLPNGAQEHQKNENFFVYLSLEVRLHLLCSKMSETLKRLSPYGKRLHYDQIQFLRGG